MQGEIAVIHVDLVHVIAIFISSLYRDVNVLSRITIKQEGQRPCCYHG